MMQVTEDTPPDMLAGAMDLTVHLPDGKPVKMSVNRSTPMMDLLIQVTTAHRLQPSAHIIQALSCAPSFKQVETILPYKPNTPIGALDTQHIKVVPKFFNKSTSRTSTLPNGYVQPFESTFRLQVHLPRNQLYVIRVNQYVLLEDIMKKVCSEKNLDPNKYEFRHPGNLQEVLDPKLTLSDYELTEVSVVHRGRAISASDVSVLQREEERRRQQSKNGGGVFNLIFKRGKSGLGSGSVSSDTRSISPTRSDDSNSRSVTPPVIQTPHILQTIQQENTQIIQSAMDKPKAPYRKRRPAPKPPSAIENTPNENECNLENSVNSTHITIEDIEDVKNNQVINDKNIEKTLMSADNGLTICHSRNSSDSSGYHEASILSDSVNLQTLPRRNKTNLTAGTSNVQQNNLKQLPGITTNLKKMETHSKSAINLTTVQRKKKAPPPPPALKTCVSVTNLSNSSSNIDSSNISIPVEIEPTKEQPFPLPRSSRGNNEFIISTQLLGLPIPKPRRKTLQTSDGNQNEISSNDKKETLMLDNSVKYSLHNEDVNLKLGEKISPFSVGKSLLISEELEIRNFDDTSSLHSLKSNQSIDESQKYAEVTNLVMNKKDTEPLFEGDVDDFDVMDFQIFENNPNININIKTTTDDDCEINCNVENIGLENSSGINSNIEMHDSSINNYSNMEMLPECISASSMKKWTNQENLNKESCNNINISTACSFLESVIPEPLEEKHSSSNLKSTNSMSINSEIIVKNSHMTTNIDPSNIEKSQVLLNTVIDKNEVNNTQKLDSFSTDTSKNVIETSIKNGKDDIAHSLPDSVESLELNTCSTLDQTNSTDDSGISADLVDTDWQYQLPSPPKAFRDSSPTNLTEITNYNTISFAGFQSESTIVNTPELIEKLEQIRDSQKTPSSGRTSEISELTDRNDEKRLSEISTETITDPPDGFSDYVNKFSLNDLEKLRSQILEKELASLKLDINNTKNKIHEINNTTEIFEDSKHNSKSSTLKVTTPEKSDANYATLPNFKISTYDKPKQAINIFEDDSIRSNVENKSTYNVNKFLESDKTSNIVENYDFKKRSSGISERELNILNTITSQNVSDKSDSLKSNPQTNENIFKKPQAIQKYKSNQSHKISKYNSSDIRVEKLSTNVQRSDSLYLSKTEEVPQQLNPVKRSLSHVSLDMYKNELPEEKESVRKSSSQWNVSDLQSLQVMRSILPKLTNSETNSSTPNLTTDNSSTSIEVKEEPTVKLRRHKYSPPSINLSTWSERPKSLVSLKSDQDYRTSSYTLSENNSTYSKNTFQANHTESQVTNKTNENTLDEVDCGKVTFNSKKVSDHCKTHVQENHPVNNKLCNQSFNINPPKSVPLQPNPVISEQTALAKKLINHTTAMGFKRPENRFNVNRAPRPHSIAFDSSIGDISRVPIVRSVELKKSFRDNSTNSSIVHLKNIDCEETPSNISKNKYFIQKKDTVNCYSTEVSNNSNESQNSDCQTSCDNNYFNSDPSSQHTDAYSKSSNELKRSTSSINSENTKNYNYNNRYNINDNYNGIRSIKIGGHHPTFGVSAPVVKGFKIQSNTKSMNNITNGTNFDKSIPIWKENSDIKINTDNQKVNTLSKTETNKFTKPVYTSNSSVPFSQNLLKRNSSSVKYEYTNSELNLKNENSVNTKIIINGVDHSNNPNKNFSNVIQIPTPPPLTPKITAVMKKPNKECCEDPRDQLLDAIRNFGGRENLKSIKRVC